MMRALLAALLLVLSLSAHADVPVPTLTAHVIDQTGTLTTDQQATLEKTLTDFEAKKGSQIAVLLVPTTAPETIEQYSIRVVDQWKLGRKKVDDGALLLIAKNDRALRIEVGYGLEGVLTDIASTRIINETIVPHLKQGDFSAGISAGIDRMMRLIDGEPLPPPAAQAAPSADMDSILPGAVIAGLVGGPLLRALLGPLLGGLLTFSLATLGVWLALGVWVPAVLVGLFVTFFSFANLARGGGFGGGGFRGGGGFGSGGGFSGGGGGFGGGGASGRF